MNVLVLVPYLYDTAPGQRFRIEQWARVLEPKGVSFTFMPFESQALRLVLYRRGQYAAKVRELLRCVRRRLALVASIDRRWDVVFLYRELLPLGPPVLERLLARKVPLVYDFDDAIFIPDVSDANRRFKWFRWSHKVGAICSLSAHVTVGNEYLRRYAERHARYVSVIPTTIDTAEYTPKDSAALNGVPVVGWSGSMTTVKHLRMLESTLQTLARSLEFRLKVIGSTGFRLPGVRVESVPWGARAEVAELRSFDIGIMPLPDDSWSRGKCGLKALQYMAVGVPTIASPVGVNSEIIEDGVNGFLAASEPEWIAKLSLLLADEDLRWGFAKEGRRTVEERYSAKVHAPRLYQIFTTVRTQYTTRCAAS